MRGLIPAPSSLRAAAPLACAEPLPRNMQRLADALRAVDDPQGRSLRLVRIGDRLPPAPLLELGEATRVPGCVSVVHVHVRLASDGTLRLAGAADSRLARGLVALLVRGLQGQPAAALERLSAQQVADASGLPGVVTPSRINGLGTMLRVLRKQLEQPAPPPAVPPPAAPPPAAEVASPRLVWTAAEEEVAVLLSGGVDSSVALHRLLAEGRRVRAFYLRIWLEDEQVHAARGGCPWEEDWKYCQAVCEQAGVPLEACSLQREYHESVVSYLVEQCRLGRTPNPDIMCNSRIKFGVFHERVGTHFAHVASGHYARSAADAAGGATRLLRSADAHKDQTYFLSQLEQRQLRDALFPIGALDKPAVRRAATELGLPNRGRKDSQGICFLGQLDYDDFLRSHLGDERGEIREHETGALIGEHRGLWFHTVGQRRGLGPVLTNQYRAKGPWHVVRKDVPSNVLYASRQYDATDKARDRFVAESINWVAGAPPPFDAGRPLALQVKVRHGAQQHDAMVTLDERGASASVALAERDKGLAPGQFAAFYDGEVCLGSGVIAEGAAF